VGGRAGEGEVRRGGGGVRVDKGEGGGRVERGGQGRGVYCMVRFGLAGKRDLGEKST